MTATKRCTKCGKDLPLDAFRRDSSKIPPAAAFRRRYR